MCERPDIRSWGSALRAALACLAALLVSLPALAEGGLPGGLPTVDAAQHAGTADAIAAASAPTAPLVPPEDDRGGAWWNPFSTAVGQATAAHRPAAPAAAGVGATATATTTPYAQEADTDPLLLLGGGLAVVGLAAWLLVKWR